MDQAGGWDFLPCSFPVFPHSRNSSSISGFGWLWVQHRNEIIINKTKAHGISALLGVLYVTSCLDLSHTYIYYPHVPLRLFIDFVSVSVTRVELGG